MTIAIGFPLIGDGTHTGATVACYLYEETPIASETLRLIHVGSQGRWTSFSFLGGEYAWIDAVLKSQKRALALVFEGTKVGRSAELVNALLERNEEDSICGGSASLAAYVATRFLLPRLPARGSRCDGYLLLTGALQLVENQLRPELLELGGLRKKSSFVGDWNDRLNQYLVINDIDKTALGNEKSECWNSRFLDSLPHRNDTNSTFVFTLPADKLDDALNELARAVGLSPVRPVLPIDGDTRVPVIAASKTDTFQALLDACLQGLMTETGASRNALEYLAGRTAVLPEALTRLLDRPLNPFPLQLQALREKRPELFDSDAGADSLNVLISGPTGSGKTALIDALVLRSILGLEGMCIYLAPTRALAAEYHRNFKSRYEGLLAHALKISPAEVNELLALSTGEDYQWDRRIRLGGVKLACMIYEKANVLSAADGNMLMDPNSKLRLVVVDELHMMSEVQRGGVLDLLLAKLRHSAALRRPGAPLRIVGITTEDYGNEFIANKAFSSGNPAEPGPSGSRAAVTLRTDDRPVRVQHLSMLSAPFEEAASIQAPVPIVSFKNSADRNLNDDAIRRSSESLAASAAAITARKPEGRSTAGGHQQFYARLIRSQLEDGFRSVIFAKGSADELFSVASQLRKWVSPLAAPLAGNIDLEARLRGADLEDGRKALLLEYIRSGIFIHSSEQPRDLREAIEAVFANAQTDPLVLLTTETLSYGVNLTADCVVLAGTEFPREGRERPGVELRPLSVNAYHNLLGRAGRYGMLKDGRDARVVVLLMNAFVQRSNVVTRTTQSSLAEVIRKYYQKPAKRSFGISALFLPRDDELGAIEGRSEPHKAAGIQAKAKRNEDVSAKKPSVGRSSFNAFRTVCDGYRYLGAWGGPDYQANPSGLLGFIREWSTYCAIEGGSLVDTDARSHEQEWELAGVKYLIDELSASLVEGGYIDESGGSYKLTKQAEALIDTGVKPTAIDPIRICLDLAVQRRDGREAWPVDLLTLAFCAAPEFWNIAAGDLCQVMHWDPLRHESEADTLLAVARSRLAACAGFVDLSQESLLQLAQDLYQKSIGADTQCLLYVASQPRFGAAQPALNQAAYFNLCAIVLRWINGDSHDSIAKLYWAQSDPTGAPFMSGPKQTPPGVFKAQISEKLGWLAQATYRFFVDDDRRLPSQLRAAVLPFGQRCRLGVTDRCVPYMTKVDSHPTPGRIEALEHAKQITAEAYQREFFSSDDLWGRRARVFYKREVAEQFSALDEKHGRTDWDDLVKTLQNVIDSPSLRGDIYPAVSAWVLSLGPKSGLSLIAEKHLALFRIGEEPDALEVELRFGTAPASFETSLVKTFVVQAPIVVAVPEQATLTAFGAITLLAWRARGFFGADAKRRMQGLSGSVTVRQIVIELSNSKELRSAGSLEERLLAFREPGFASPQRL